MIRTDEIKTIPVKEIEKELRDILRFWSENTLDLLHGGFIGELDNLGNVKAEADKGAVLNARLLWAFSAAYHFFQEPAYLAIADRAYRYLIDHFWDDENGGLYWSVNGDGSLKNSRKQAYAQGFGIYGFSEYYKVSGKKESLNYAVELFWLLESHFKDEQYGGYIEALAHDWRPLEDMRLSDKDANEPKSMNTHLHIIEPYTNLYRVWPNKGLKACIQDLILVFRDRIIDLDTFHFNLFFEMDWPVKSEIVSYGHDIEGAWLLNEAAHVIQDEKLMAQMKVLSLKMAEATLSQGVDKDGGLFYEREEGHLDTDKHWWPQAEALVGFLDAYQNSYDPKYLEAHHSVWRFILKYLKDPDHGEWFWKVNQQGNPDPALPKVGFWKCPYHNSRALMEVITRLNAM